jgi:DNA topoisomerase-1
MPWTRRGRKGAFGYLDQQGRPIRDPAKFERIEKLAIPPAWKEVRISPSPKAKLQATGLDKAGRTQYLYHADFRAARTIEDFRPRHLRVVGAREAGLDPEEQAFLSLLRSWRIRQAQVAA